MWGFRSCLGSTQCSYRKCSAHPVQALFCVPSFCLIWPKCPTYLLLHAPRCTWDAFYSTVSARGLVEGLGSLHAGGIVPRLLIIDDGWQVSWPNTPWSLGLLMIHTAAPSLHSSYAFGGALAHSTAVMSLLEGVRGCVFHCDMSCVAVYLTVIVASVLRSQRVSCCVCVAVD